MVNRDPYIIRDMRADDIGAVSAIERNSFRTPWTPGMFRSELERAGGWQRVALALPGERVVGYLLCRLFYDVWHVLNIAVAPDHRRRGVAAALMEEFLEWAKVSKLSVTLEVRPSNEAALALYKKLAFFREGVRRGYYADTGEDALIMTWSPWAGLSREPGTNKEAENGE